MSEDKQHAENLGSSVGYAALWHGGSCEVPKSVALCPECGGELYVRCHGWIDDTGQPIASELQIDCKTEEWILDDDQDAETGHRWWQSDWQSVRDAVVAWAKAESV